jgi:tetratricopeptide (TPR) repeat protein
LEDIVAHTACVPDSPWYEHVYPAWVLAEAGDLNQGLQEARAIAAEAPDDIQAVLTSAACLRVLGNGAEAQSLLESQRGQVHATDNLVPPQSEAWLQALYDMSLGERSLDEVLQLADANAEPRKLRAEAFFHSATAALAEGRREDTIQLFAEAFRSFDNELRYTFHARTLLIKMLGDPNWPIWISPGQMAGWKPAVSTDRINR